VPATKSAGMTSAETTMAATVLRPERNREEESERRN